MDLFRLFGDVNGDRTVNGLDLALFRGAFGTSLGNPNHLDYLDQNGDGSINGLDLAVFRTRFGTTLPRRAEQDLRPCRTSRRGAEQAWRLLPGNEPARGRGPQPPWCVRQRDK
jgi:hypothetical protein